MRNTCEKCQQYRALVKSAQLYGESYGETWSGVVNGLRVWYDVSLAKKLIEAALRDERRRTGCVNDHTQEFSVADLWRNQVSSAYVVEEHLPHVNPAEPVILAVTHRDKGDEYLSLIEGTHRVARAYREGRATIRAYRLSYEFSESLRIDPESAITSEIVTEALASGAKVETVSDGFVVRGGTLRPSTPDDHPLRAEIVARLQAVPGEIVVRTV